MSNRGVRSVRRSSDNVVLEVAIGPKGARIGDVEIGLADLAVVLPVRLTRAEARELAEALQENALDQPDQVDSNRPDER